MTLIEKHIKHYFDSFLYLYNYIIENCSDRIEGAILATTYLDSLAKSRYGGNSKSERFNNFILNYSGQRDVYEKISIPLLKYGLQKQSGKCDTIINLLEREFSIGEFEFIKVGYDVDVNIVGLEQRTMKYLDEPQLRLLIKTADRYKYSMILWYDYRCNLVHETRFPKNMARTFQNHSEPFYSSLLNMSTKMPQTTFCIPPVFIFRTLQNCINNYKNECIAINWDPFNYIID
jgi:hypothetical protein